MRSVSIRVSINPRREGQMLVTIKKVEYGILIPILPMIVMIHFDVDYQSFECSSYLFGNVNSYVYYLTI